jgi:hypothetical protein
MIMIGDASTQVAVDEVRLQGRSNRKTPFWNGVGVANSTFGGARSPLAGRRN